MDKRTHKAMQTLRKHCWAEMWTPTEQAGDSAATGESTASNTGRFKQRLDVLPQVFSDESTSCELGCQLLYPGAYACLG